MSNKPKLDYLPCGHQNYQDVYLDKDMTAKKASLLKEKAPYKTVFVEKPGKRYCPGCAEGRPVNYRFQEGKYRQPIPENQQRTLQKTEQPGFPGLCTDPVTHLYIGGLYNDCRKVKENKRLCEVHKSWKRKK